MKDDCFSEAATVDEAIRTGNNIALVALIDSGANLNGCDGGDLPLTTAVLHNNPEALDILLGAGADPNQAGSDGYTPIHHAIKHGRIAMTAQLMTHGAKPVQMASQGVHTFFRAVEGLTGSLKELIASNPATQETLTMTDDFGVTPLMSMVERGNLLVVTQMLAMGADIHAADRNLNTALHRSAKGYNAEMAQLLLQHGARYDAPNVDGKTPLDFAQEKGAKDSVRQVFEAHLSSH